MVLEEPVEAKVRLGKGQKRGRKKEALVQHGGNPYPVIMSPNGKSKDLQIGLQERTMTVTFKP